MEYQDETFSQEYDALTNSPDLQGSAGGEDISGERAVFSAFAEALLPILSNLEVDLAVRYDNYSDFGDTSNPKLGIAYRPFDSVLLRGGYADQLDKALPNAETVFVDEATHFLPQERPDDVAHLIGKFLSD